MRRRTFRVLGFLSMFLVGLGAFGYMRLWGSSTFALPPPQVVEDAEIVVGDALVGVDPYGRILVAIDERPKDGLVDRFLLSSAEYRREGSWQRRLKNVVGILRAGSISIVSGASKYVFSVSVQGQVPPQSPYPPQFEQFIVEDSIELRHVPEFAGELPSDSIYGNVYLSSLDVENHYSGWPEMFDYDILDPHDPSGFCEGGCMAGGSGATSCSYGPCLNGTMCSTTCGGMTYACCGCWPQPLGEAYCICCEIGPI